MENPYPPSTLKGNVVLAALLFGGALVATGLIVHHGLTSAADILAGAVDSHAVTLSTHVDQHAKVLSTPRLTFDRPVAVEQPVTIRGPHADGALPVHALIGK